jgi:D-alanyl-lipoteichoic acid acyltransferase DltB (MBOAT superfamily)
MLFSSLPFILGFLPLSFAVYFGLHRQGWMLAARAWLLLASLFFYGWWNPLYLPLILASIGANFFIGRAIGRRRARLLAAGGTPLAAPALLGLGVGLNLLVLAFFKYADFLIGNLNTILVSEYPLPGIVLPLAISFFTFQQIAYLVDCWREGPHDYDFVSYGLFVTFFPQLIAGPIVHHREMMPQFSRRWNQRTDYRNIAAGLFIFTLGLFKKVVIADSFAQWVAPGFDQGVELGFFAAWLTSLSYTFQLYFDFSGYTDMAIGAALLFNIRLPINFNSPYQAVNIQDFWRRWHITLSRFLRDYLYIPLGGSRQGWARTQLSLMLTFVLGGLWHGASWMFVIWGALHGVATVLHRWWQRLGGRMPHWLGWLLTFNFVNIAWVFFRAPDLATALRILAGMAGLNGVILPARLLELFPFLGRLSADFGNWLDLAHWPASLLAYCVAALLAVLLLPNSTQLLGRRGWQVRFASRRWAVVLAALFMFALVKLAVSQDIEFLYFNF